MTRSPAETSSGAPASRWAEWVTVLVLLAMAGVLAWINVSLHRRREPQPFPAFDLKNPMLRAQPRDCVEVVMLQNPRETPCISVREEGVVLRPAQGPKSLPGYPDLQRAAPYLACRDKRVESGSGGCGTGKPLPTEEPILYPLDGFGIPSVKRVRPDSIEPVWVEIRGREQLLYLVVLQDYAGPTWKLYVSPEGRVTGLVRVVLLSEKPGVKEQTLQYTDVPGGCAGT